MPESPLESGQHVKGPAEAAATEDRLSRAPQPSGVTRQGKTASCRKGKEHLGQELPHSAGCLPDAARGTGCELGLGHRPSRCLLCPPAPITPRGAVPPSCRTGLRIIYVNSYGLLCVTRGPWKLEHPTSKRGPGERFPATKCCSATQRLPVSWEKPLTHANHAAYPQPDAHSSQTSPAPGIPILQPPWSAQG